MSFTTPPRPHDILGLFPDLAQYARPAVRLHPRQGEPEIDQSSIGGPLRWPADEAWPTCDREHDDWSTEPFDYILAVRRYRAEPAPSGLQVSQIRKAHQRRMRELELVHAVNDQPDEDAPTPLIPVAQLYYRDIPGLPWAGRFDLLQILWCPRNHPNADTPYNPVVELRWRATKTITGQFAAPARPAACAEEYVPNPCVVHPEVVTEYPNTGYLPPPLEKSIRDWQDEMGDNPAYHWESALAPGWKVLGHGGYWGVIDSYPMVCECGEEQLPLFTVAYGEYDGGTHSWRPVENDGTDPATRDPVEVIIGRGYTLQLYYCPRSERHTNRTEMF